MGRDARLSREIGHAHRTNLRLVRTSRGSRCRQKACSGPYSFPGPWRRLVGRGYGGPRRPQRFQGVKPSIQQLHPAFAGFELGFAVGPFFVGPCHLGEDGVELVADFDEPLIAWHACNP